MTIAVEPRVVPPPASRIEGFVFETANWDYYNKTLEVGQGQRIRVNYDAGRMEIMTLSDEHESIKKAVARVFEHYAHRARIRALGRGSVTCRREDVGKGLEPDECYYIVSRPVRDSKGQLDLIGGPPPDLVIEVEVTRSVVARRPIYRALKVPEIWRVDPQRISVLQLGEADYQPAERSRFFPMLDIEALNRWVRIAVDDPDRAIDELDKWFDQQHSGPQE